MRSTQFDLSGKRVLVTGGTGFIGGRLVERLVLEHKADVRVLVRNFARAPRIARFPIEMVQGDVTRPGDVERAVSGCEVVFHCAYGNQGNREMQRLVNVEGTRNVLAAALHARVKRVVYLSTLMVYGTTPDGDLDEVAPRRYSGNIYADSKLDAERIAFDYIEKHGLSVAILQPTAVYGPFAPVWAVDVLQRLKTEHVILVNGGDGLCNAVYIDDAVSAILLAAVKESAVGEAFLISGEQPVTWRDFYGGYARMLGTAEMVSVSAAELLKAHYAQKRRKTKGILRETLSILREDPLIRERLLRTPEVVLLTKAGRSLLPKPIRQSLKRRIGSNSRTSRPQVASEREKPLRPMSPPTVQFYAAKTRVRIGKAKRMLGYQPAFDLESGMRLTEQWARWANLL
ncbi:MAG: NAD-dependent epimerase/dehydratase family protein [Chloroflexi bacterium]|nr:NAD-dependent epimerase/dehydratase family protein [Chloroflexota bacterium]